MKSISFFIALSLITLHAVFAQSPTVIELFTSQGCSSCPPADRLLDKIAAEYGEDVIVLSYHVDYWDYIGWKDPYGSKQNTQYQYDYGNKFKSSSVYTPQAVVNGRTHLTGSNEQGLIDAIIKYETKKSNTSIIIDGATRKGNMVNVLAEVNQLPSDAQITYAITIKEKITTVSRGENRNKKLKNTHVVATFLKRKPADLKKNVQLEIPAWVFKNDDLDVVIYVTSPKDGIIASATQNVNFL